MVGRTVDYYMGPYSPNLKPGVQRVRISDTGGATADLRDFMELKSIIVRSHGTDGSEKSGKIAPIATAGNFKYPPLKEKEKRLLFRMDYFSSLIKQAYNVLSNKEIVAHWCFEDEDRTQWILEIVIDSLCKANWNAESMFSVFEAILDVHDSIENWRVETAMNVEENGMMDVINYYKDRYPKFTVICLQHTIQYLKQFPMIAGYLYATRKIWWDNSLQSWFASRLDPLPPNSNDELVPLAKELKELYDGNLQLKQPVDYKSLWTPSSLKGTKPCKLYVQKF